MYIKAVYGIEYALVSIAVNTLITFVMLNNSQKLMDILGRNGAIALSKIMSILLAAIAIAMVREGILEIMEGG